MHFNKLKKAQAIFLAALITLSLAGCGNKTATQKETPKTDTESKESSTKVDFSQADEKEVTLPKDCENMIYPIEALMTQENAKGLPYYSEDSSAEEADSFWFSMAVLSSLMYEDGKEGYVDVTDEYYYLSDDLTQMYANALYDAFGTGNLEFPELPEDDRYAVYDEDQDAYGFLIGDIGDSGAKILSCEETDDGYEVKVSLVDEGSGDTQQTYEIDLEKTSYMGEDNLFAYAVSSFEVAEDSKDGDLGEMTEKAPEATTEDLEELPEATTEDESEATDQDGNAVSSNSSSIDREKAENLAENYYGEDAEYSYKGTVTIGDYEYYDFSVEGENITSTDVLVSTSGQDVIGGVQNSDGSWSFDQ